MTSTPSGNGWLYIGWRSYARSNGETWPAVCDLNGDGAGEVVLGLGEGGSGWSRAFDSATNFGTLSGTASSRGWFRLGWTEYNSAVGVVYPACGDIDDDGKDELLLGQDSYQPGGRFEVRDDVGAGMAQIDWGEVDWGAYNSADGLSRPAMAR